MAITLKAARVNRNLSQLEAAKKIGVTQPTIANWESGKTVPDIIQLKKIEEVYEISYNDLIFLPSNHA